MPTLVVFAAPDKRSSLNDSYQAVTNWMMKSDENVAAQSEDGSEYGGQEESSALKYTKSVVQRFWSGQDLLIAVMGMTGSGKTTFISKVTGRKDLKVGHNLTSCTRDIEVIETKIEISDFRLRLPHSMSPWPKWRRSSVCWKARSPRCPTMREVEKGSD
ncbi:hypothetical protein NUW58_g5172 [Xylaria curta]|uniref:Uncharacterized protein n=1 Tax=Xylaria curta TaxID=42375 RepID=A0ACC1P2U5_9PEZI|nr:hypothetical protein NUW58_g5172 [Xylaria curta]